MNKVKIIIFAIVAFFSIHLMQFAQVDFIVLLDTSQSMIPFFHDTTSKIVSSLQDENLTTDYRFHLISFAEKPDVEVSGKINTAQDLETAFSRYLLLQPLGNHTDFVEALDFTYQYAAGIRNSDRKILLIMTDGIHDPPQGSRYPIENDQNNRRHLDTLLTRIKSEGWKVILYQYPLTDISSADTLDYNTSKSQETTASADSTTASQPSTETASAQTQQHANTDQNQDDTSTPPDSSEPVSTTDQNGDNNMLNTISDTLNTPVHKLNENGEEIQTSGNDEGTHTPSPGSDPSTASDTVSKEKTSLIANPLFWIIGSVLIVFITILVIFLYRRSNRTVRNHKNSISEHSHRNDKTDQNSILGKAANTETVGSRAAMNLKKQDTQPRTIHHKKEEVDKNSILGLAANTETTSERAALNLKKQPDQTVSRHNHVNETLHKNEILHHAANTETTSYRAAKNLKHQDTPPVDANIHTSAQQEQSEAERQKAALMAIKPQNADKHRVKLKDDARLIAHSKGNKYYPIPKDYLRMRDHHPIQLVVMDHFTLTGGRNIHWLGKGQSRSIGGEGSSFYLIFEYPLPENIAEILYENDTFTFIPLKKEFFPTQKEPLVNCLNTRITIQVENQRGVILFREFVSEVERVNRILAKVKQKPVISSLLLPPDDQGHP